VTMTAASTCPENFAKSVVRRESEIPKARAGSSRLASVSQTKSSTSNEWRTRKWFNPQRPMPHNNTFNVLVTSF